MNKVLSAKNIASAQKILALNQEIKKQEENLFKFKKVKFTKEFLLKNALREKTALFQHEDNAIKKFFALDTYEDSGKKDLDVWNKLFYFSVSKNKVVIRGSTMWRGFAVKVSDLKAIKVVTTVRNLNNFFTKINTLYEGKLTIQLISDHLDYFLNEKEEKCIIFYLSSNYVEEFIF